MTMKTKIYVLLCFCIFALFLYFSYVVCFTVGSDVKQGIAQKIFYYHVPTAWVSFIAFGISLYHSLLYILKRELEHDGKAVASVSVGLVFATGVLITGPLWAKPIWGTYWNWSDQRLISFFILWIIFVGYLLLRYNIHDIHKKAIVSSVLNIIGFCNIPLVYFSIRIWNTPSHPQPVLATRDSSYISPDIRWALWLSVLCFLLIMLLLLSLAIRDTKIQRLLYQSATDPSENLA